MRELRVEDALLYLDQVKVEFGDRPHIYNEFLDIMKTFKTQQIDTPGVIRRVSNLFKGNRRLVLGFNTFLPEGYQIELPSDGKGPPVAVYRAPGSNVAQVLRESAESQAHGLGGPVNPLSQQQPPQPPPPHGHPPPMVHHPSGPPQQQHAHASRLPQHAEAYGQKPMAPMQPHSHAPAGPPQQSIMPRDAAGMPGRPPMDQRVPPPQHPPHHAPQMSQQQPPPPPREGKMPASGPPPHVAGPPMNGGAARRPGSPPPPWYADPSQAPREGKMPASEQPPRGAPMNAAGARRPASPPNQPWYPDQAQQHVNAAVPQQQQQQQGNAAAPLEFDHAINYVTTIKKRFATEPEIYKKFLEILHTYQKEQRGIKDVLEEVSTLFADHPDLLKEFTFFLPDGVQAQAKAQLDQAAKEAEARKRAKAQKAIMNTAQGMQRQAQSGRARQPDYDRNIVNIPFGALQGRTEEQENAIIRGSHFGVVSFDPVRPPRKDALTPAQAAIKKGRPTSIPLLPTQPNTSETSFFQRAKQHLERRELQSERPLGSRRHTPYMEFLKCLHLFGAGVVNRDELVLLLKNLFLHGHAPKTGANSSTNQPTTVVSDANDLLREMEEVLVGRGGYARQESSLKDKSKYGTLRTRDFDFTNCEHPTPSYYTYPNDYPASLFLSNPGQSNIDSSVQQDTVICVGHTNGKRKTPSIEDYDGVRERHNAYEEMMFRIEDERYELDMAIERNVHALRHIEPFAEEVQELRDREEKDGQPIGRLQYRLNRYAMNSIHINAIARIYGERGDEVLQHLVRNPLVVLPIVYQRLKQKDAEWRKVKSDMSTRLNSATAANYEGSLDVLCYFNRRGLERRATASRLRDDCTRARTYCRHADKIKDHPAAQPFAPTYSLFHSDLKAFLFQPYVAVISKLDVSHKHALDLIFRHIHADAKVSGMIRERVGRIAAEFLAPWFNYPAHWILAEVRETFRCTMSQNVVKFAAGQRVVTIFGEGTVASFVKATGQTAAKYRVKLPFGVAFLSPTALLYGVPSKENQFVRRDGAMVRDEPNLGEDNTGALLGDKYQLMFGTETIYLLLRSLTFLCSVLTDTREHCASFPLAKDPALSYCNSFQKDSDAKKHVSVRLDFSQVLAALQKVASGKMSARDFETLGRKVSKEKAHQIAAMPKLIERCAHVLVKAAKEDAILNLYDYCQHRNVNPVVVQTHCFAVASDASYRIQYNSSSGEMCFSYVPKGVALLMEPTDEIKSYSEEEVASENGGATSMDVDEEEDPITEYDTADSTGPPALKKVKLK